MAFLNVVELKLTGNGLADDITQLPHVTKRILLIGSILLSLVGIHYHRNNDGLSHWLGYSSLRERLIFKRLGFRRSHHRKLGWTSAEVLRTPWLCLGL